METDYKEKHDRAKALLQEWIDKQGHDRCWYYPEIFEKLVDVLEVKMTVGPSLPPVEQFRMYCDLYRVDQYRLAKK